MAMEMWQCIGLPCGVAFPQCGIMSDSPHAKQIRALAEAALQASYALAATPTAIKNAALRRMAELLEDPEARKLLAAANALDLSAAEASGLSGAMLDRLRLTPARIDGMIEGIRQVIALPDPVGAVLEERSHPTGFNQRKVRVPIGVIGIIYESRPNVTIDCAILCLKSGNATLLRGGKEAFHSNTALAGLITDAIRSAGIHEAAVQLIPTTDRAALNELLRMDDCIHCLIPRGGESLIRFVADNARMPVIKHYKGVCNVFVDAEADATMAAAIVVNAKCQRPSVCNAAENLIIHRERAAELLPELGRQLHGSGAELRADEEALQILTAAAIPCTAASSEDFDTEYLEKIISIKVVGDLDEAIAFINRHGSGHSDAIITANADAAAQFQQRVDSAAVYWNVSTRFTDGFEFGLGAEIGISTDKLHARGPMGLNELTSYKFLLSGNGQIRT